MVSSIFLKQAGAFSRRKTPSALRTKRSLSTPAPPLKPTLPPPGIPPLVSRRAWNKVYKPPPRKPRGKDSLDEKPWPRSIQLTGYAVGTTLVPYAILWFIAGNKSLRESLEPYAPGLMPFLRKWYGEEEPDAVSYVDVREEGDKLEVPKSLDHEICAKERKEQESLQTLLKEHLVPTRLRVYTEGGFNISEILDLPGTTLASTKTLLAVLMQDRSRSIGEDVVTHLTVEFTDVKVADQEDTGDVVLDIHLPEETSTLKSQIADMIKTANIFSSWHYFPEVLAQQQEENRKPKPQKAHARQQEEIRIQQLEYEIENLEKLLKDHTTMRSFDDIEEELSRHRSELRRLKWKKRLNIFG